MEIYLLRCPSGETENGEPEIAFKFRNFVVAILGCKNNVDSIDMVIN